MYIILFQLHIAHAGVIFYAEGYWFLIASSLVNNINIYSVIFLERGDNVGINSQDLRKGREGHVLYYITLNITNILFIAQCGIIFQ
jgi:hypothetical protein